MPEDVRVFVRDYDVDGKYVEFPKEENKTPRTRIPGQVHTKPDERRRLAKLGKAIGRGVEALLTIVSISMKRIPF